MPEEGGKAAPVGDTRAFVTLLTNDGFAMGAQVLLSSFRSCMEKDPSSASPGKGISGSAYKVRTWSL